VHNKVEEMRQSISLAIGVRITKSDDTIVDVDDLSPLLETTSGLLERARADKISINPSSVRKGEHSLTLASLDGTVVFLACATEETSNREQTRYLVQARRRELGTVFGNIMGSMIPPSQQYPHEPKSVTALFLLAAAFQAAQQLVLEGKSRRTSAGYCVEAMYLRVVNRDEELNFEIIPTGVCRSTASESVH
jgi:hypothetical protein